MNNKNKKNENEEVRILLGNAAIGRGLIEAGCHVIASYPGTPSSEIVPAAVAFKKELGLNTYIEWSANEKIAFDNAMGAAMTGKRAATAMKQVGLNVATDSLMSSAYMGTVGGMLIISCDDPGPQSSQTEQDSRFHAMFAKVPAYDPSTPQEAKEMVKEAFDLSEEFEIPVMLRATVRVSHATQSVRLSPVREIDRPAEFKKDPTRWAATPKFRLRLHQKLNESLEKIQERFEKDTRWNTETGDGREKKLGLITCSVSFSIIMDILKELGLTDEVNILKIGTPYPLPQNRVNRFINKHEKVLIVEETDSVIEFQIIDKKKVLGRLTGHVPSAGELTPDVIYGILSAVMGELGIADLGKYSDSQLSGLIEDLSLPVRKPVLCAGCPHRASYFAIRRAFPKGLYPSDIGCYTLGQNMEAVDTAFDMGAGITLASGFYQAYNLDDKYVPIIATMGDSTFYHSGTSSLLNAVYNKAKFILMLLDNEITAMTGMQPTPGIGITATGEQGKRIPLKELVEGCGVEWLRIVDPYDVENTIKVLKEAGEYTRQKAGGVAVIIAQHPCLIRYTEELKENRIKVEITDKCIGCHYCIDYFGCPALVPVEEEERVEVDRKYCVDCGNCLPVCARKAIVEVK